MGVAGYWSRDSTGFWEGEIIVVCGEMSSSSPAMAGTGEEDVSVSFGSPEEEVEYWKEKALEYRAR